MSVVSKMSATPALPSVSVAGVNPESASLPTGTGYLLSRVSLISAIPRPTSESSVMPYASGFFRIL